MSDRKDDHLVLLDHVQQCVWKTGEPFASDISRNGSSAFRKVLKKSDCGLNFRQESIAESGSSEVVILDILGEIRFSTLVEPGSHFW